MSPYDAALSMLLVRRDAERGIGAVEGIRTTEYGVPLLQTLAYWLLRNGRSQTNAVTIEKVRTPSWGPCRPSREMPSGPAT
ncbi:hypothetical protein ACFV8Z_22530 [Streptomyces sp. NPDC059837]|uniref:hypothetical protein n=1 Tax=unclassified Streptomyces TaxID=2593676 RepID=UPI00224D141F|nr:MULTISPECIES: hypothetical protein [unclassified Streptomyces]MCX4405611.1 hypothetical protein [Streptomyces sp. NBC_01764]MCX5189839.1 hypothetical protein [Streptomyces sp. NBC_00268]